MQVPFFNMSEKSDPIRIVECLLMKYKNKTTHDLLPIGLNLRGSY